MPKDKTKENKNTNETPKKKASKPMANGWINTIRIVAPLVVIAICGFLVYHLTAGVVSDMMSISGRYEAQGEPSGRYIEIDDNMNYQAVTGEDFVSSKGKCEFSQNLISFAPDSGEKFSGRFVENSYIVFEDKNFLKGQVPTSGTFDGEVAGTDVSYGFTSDGKFNSIVEGANSEIGTYVIDGYFILVTIGDEKISFLNCGDGITSDYYKHV